MSGRGKYKTKQYDEILRCISGMPGHHFSVYDLHARLADLGYNVGITTLYRNLDRMIDEGIVSKYATDGKGPACFAYMDPDSDACCEKSYHCRCEVCGRLIHLECSEIEELQYHLLEEHHFRIDPLRTIFYGVCEDCLRSSNEEVK